MKRLVHLGVALLAVFAFVVGGVSVAASPQFLVAPAAPLPSLPPSPEPGAFVALQDVDLISGRSLYVAYCGRCHGIDGGGGEGPRLAVDELQRAADIDAVQRIIIDGIPGTSMPQIWMLAENEARNVAAYVWSLGHNEGAPKGPPGDPAEGAALYASMDCSSCHVIDGKGGTMGPVLSNIGYLRSPEHLRQSLVDPGATLPPNFDSQVGSTYLMVTVRTRDGRRITGMRINEDTFTIQVRDEENVFHSIRKDDVAQLDKRFGESLMPSYATRLTDEGLEALVAYLATLKGGS